MTDADLLRIEGEFQRWRRTAPRNAKPLFQTWVDRQTEFSQSEAEEWAKNVREHGGRLQIALEGFQALYVGVE